MKSNKEDIVSVFEQLPPGYKREAADFADFLLEKSKREKPVQERDSSQDPILQMIGIAETAPFAEKLDVQLYDTELK